MGTKLPWGHKQLHILHEGEKEDWGNKRSLKRKKICKVTKGEHVFSKFVKEHRGYGHKACACGKKSMPFPLCYHCSKQLKQWFQDYCDDTCRGLDKIN